VASPESLQRRTTAERVAHLLRNEIQGGQLRPGARLRQHDIAVRFGVSTTPVREAFALLQAQGLVRIDAHRGAIVFRPSPRELVESQEIRCALELLAVTKAMGRIDDSTVQELRQMIEKMRDVEAADDWVELNDRFHMRLYEASDNHSLVEMIAALRETSNIYIRMFVDRQPVGARSDDQHEEILEACIAHDYDRARRVLKDHLEGAVDKLVEILNAPEGEPVDDLVDAEPPGSSPDGDPGG
jgi:DNA-binding GntR family transcriptional regulator